MFLKISLNSQKNRKASVRSLFFNKETPTHVFCGEFCKIFKNTFLQSSSGGCFWKWCYHNLADHFEDCSKIPLNLDFHDCFWKLNLMSGICEVKSQISECNLQSNVVHHSPYHMKWIWYSLHQALGIFFANFTCYQ